jgi:predicted MFS family arabinose efflux permease
MSLRTGRNFRYAAAGHAVTAGLMGAAGTYFSNSAIFVTAAALCVPAFIALSFIRPEEIDYARARNAAKGESGIKIDSVLALARNHSLLLFAGCLVLFQLADASVLPLLGESLARQAGSSTILMSVLIIVPQIVVAALAPWVGYHSEARGRRPLLLIGFGIEPVRAGILALSANYGLAVVAQVLDGISGAIVSVLTVLVITDLTTGSGRFNLARGAVGTLSAIAASVSTAITGFAIQALGHGVAFGLIAIFACGATALLWLFQSETKPAKYED